MTEQTSISLFPDFSVQVVFDSCGRPEATSIVDCHGDQVAFVTATHSDAIAAWLVGLMNNAPVTKQSLIIKGSES